MSDDKAIDLYYEHLGTKVGIGLSEQTVTKIANANSTLLAPVSAWLQGKAAQITVGFLPFYDKLAERKNQNLQNLALEVMQELRNREDEGKPIPDKFEDTDNLLLIQDNASTTSDEKLLKMWAKLYTVEACTPGSVSRKTIKIIETMDSNIAKIIENTILPYCDGNGFFWGGNKKICNLLLACDYGIIDSHRVSMYADQIEKILNIVIDDDYTMFLLPGYGYSSLIGSVMYKLTQPGLEIYQNLKVKKNKQHLDIIFKNIEKAAYTWSIINEYNEKIKYKCFIKPEYKYIICTKNNDIILPKTSPFKNYNDFVQFINSNIEVTNNAE